MARERSDTAPGRTVVRADSDLLTWEGAVEVEHTGEWSRPWRLPYRRIGLFPGERLRARAAMPAGVRLVFGTDAARFGVRAVPGPDTAAQTVDLVEDGRLQQSAVPRTDGTFWFDTVPSGERTVEVWLPQYGDFRLVDLVFEGGARVWTASAPGRRLLCYGSSITQCRTAASPARTWPGVVARATRTDLTCLGFGGECHLDPMVARMLRDLPADLIIACLGVNVHAHGSFSERSFLPAVLGFLSTVRDGHPGVPLLVISPILAPDREESAGRSGMTLAGMREQVGEAVRLLRAEGDPDLYLLDGRDVLGPGQEDLLVDGLHPGADGYEHMADAILPVVTELLAQGTAGERAPRPDPRRLHPNH